MSLYASLLSVMLATNSTLVAISNQVQAATGIAIPVVNANDPQEKALHQIMLDDDAAMDEVTRWINDNQGFEKNGAGESKAELNKRIHARFDLVRKEYQGFVQTYTNSARGYLAYGTFLNDIGEEDNAATEYEKSRQIDPKNPAVWNNLANYYGEFGPVTNAFTYYEKAIELDPTEPVYFQNFATTVYLFRHDVTNFYGINESQVFDKALDLYRQAMKLAPDDLPLATDYAISYYEIHPTRTNDELMAWTNALKIAKDDNEREGIYVHLARIKISIGRWEEAQAHLNDITNAVFAEMRRRLERNLYQKKQEAGITNGVVKP